MSKALDEASAGITKGKVALKSAAKTIEKVRVQDATVFWTRSRRVGYTQTTLSGFYTHSNASPRCVHTLMHTLKRVSPDRRPRR